MTIRRLGLLVLGSAIMLAACEKPYVYDAREYDRTRPDFGRELTDRKVVDICYFTHNSTPQDVLALAEAECSKFNKTARYRYSENGECPLDTPTVAHFACDAH